MIYLKSTPENVVIKIDTKLDKAFVMKNGTEVPLGSNTTLLTDACLENNRVSEKEYLSSKG